MNIFQKAYHNKTLRNGGLFSLYSFFQKGISFVLLIVLARFISPGEYGLLSLFNTVTMFFGYIIGLNTAGYLSVSFFANKERDGFKKDFTIIILLTMGSMVLLSVFIFLFMHPLSSLLRMTPALLAVSLLMAFLQTYIQILLNYYRVQEKVIAYGVYSCSSSLLAAVLVLVFVLLLRQGWYGYVEGHIFSLTVFAGIALLAFKKWRLYVFRGLTLTRFKEIIAWGIPLIPHLAATWIRQGMDRYIIEHYHTTADVGIFSFALNLTNIIIMIGTSFNNTYSVNIFKTLSTDMPLSQKAETLKKQNKKIVLVYIAATILVIMGVSLCIPLCLPNYSTSIKYFMILSLYGLCQCFYFQYCNYFFYFKKTQVLMHITFGSSLIHLFLSLLLTQHSLMLTCWIYVLVQVFIVVMVRNLGAKMLK